MLGYLKHERLCFIVLYHVNDRVIKLLGGGERDYYCIITIVYIFIYFYLYSLITKQNKTKKNKKIVLLNLT